MGKFCDTCGEEHGDVDPAVRADYDQLRAKYTEMLTYLLTNWRRIRAEGDPIEIDTAAFVRQLMLGRPEKLAFVLTIAVERIVELEQHREEAKTGGEHG